MGGTIDLLHVVIVRRVLVFVPNDETDRGARGFPLVDAGEELHLVILLAGSHDARLPRFAAVQLLLDEGGVQLDAGRTTVDHATYAGAMRLAERGQCVDLSKCIAHDLFA